MPNIRIVTTTRSLFNALRFQGLLVTDCHAQLQSVLEKELSHEHALLLAEPAHDAAGGNTDWYTPVQGTIVPLTSLPPEEQEKARKKITRLASDVDALAKRLAEDENSSRSIRSNILSLALRYPGREHLYMAGEQPVMTCWGFAPGTVGAQPEDLVRFGQEIPPLPPRHVPAGTEVSAVKESTLSRAGFPWLRVLLSLLLGILLLLALYFLLGLLFGPSGCGTLRGALPTGCAAKVPSIFPNDFQGIGGGCTQGRDFGCAQQPLQPLPAPETPALISALTAEEEKEQALRRQLENLHKQVDERAAQCPRQDAPVPEKKPAAAPPLPADEPSAPPLLADLMPLTPEDPPSPPVETPQSKPSAPVEQPVPKVQPKPKKQAKGEDLRIPEEAKQKNDMSFLEGCWTSESGLMSKNTGEPLQTQYCFDAKGRGTRVVLLSESKQRCVGPVQARFDSSGRLHIRADGASCPKGGMFVPQEVECTSGNKGSATCKGREKDPAAPQRHKWGARFRRS